MYIYFWKLCKLDKSPVKLHCPFSYLKIATQFTLLIHLKKWVLKWALKWFTGSPRENMRAGNENRKVELKCPECIPLLILPSCAYFIRSGSSLYIPSPLSPTKEPQEMTCFVTTRQ